MIKNLDATFLLLLFFLHLGGVKYQDTLLQKH